MRSGPLVAGAVGLLALGFVLTAPPMVTTAQGCSGAPSVPSEDWGAPWLSFQYPGSTIPTDAPIVIRGKRHSFTPNLGGAFVKVTDAFSQPVTGSLWVEPTMHEWPATSYLVWRPDQPLLASSTYVVSWGVEQPSGVSLEGEATLSTTDATSLLPDLAVSANLTRTHALTGPHVTCTDYGTSYGCSPTTIDFGMTEAQPYGIRVWVESPLVPYTYQVLTLEEAPGKGTFLDTHREPLSKERAVIATPWLSHFEFAVWFTEMLPEYCVTLVQRDLRNDYERKQLLCVPRVDLEPVGGVTLDFKLSQCSEPPNGALLGAWCAVHPTHEQCASIPPKPNSDGGVAPKPNDSGVAIAPEPNDSDSDDGGCACTLQRAPLNSGSVGGAFLGLLALLRRRRGRGRVGTGRAG